MSETGALLPLSRRLSAVQTPLLRTWVAVWLLGTINNFVYVVVLSSAKSVCASFGKEHLIGFIQWASVGVSIFVRMGNSYYLATWSHMLRMTIAALLTLTGLLLMALSISFPFTVFAVLLMGIGTCLGECVILAHLQHISPKLTSSWSSGTGMAGVAGSLSYLVLKSVLELDNQVIFLIFSPTALIYWFSYKVTESDPLYHRPNLVESESHASQGGSWFRTKRAFGLVWFPATQLGLVYFLEYVVYIGFAAQSNPGSEHSSSWWIYNSYEILSVCYQVGVFISRSSLSLFVIERVWILTIIQTANFILWLWHVNSFFMDIWVQFAMMVFVGLLGGASYVNIFYSLIRLDKNPIPKEDREFCINLTGNAMTVGVILASVFELIYDAMF